MARQIGPEVLRFEEDGSLVLPPVTKTLVTSPPGSELVALYLQTPATYPQAADESQFGLTRAQAIALGEALIQAGQSLRQRPRG